MNGRTILSAKGIDKEALYKDIQTMAKDLKDAARSSRET